MPVLTPRFHDALSFATETHEGQVRKETAIPYVSHPLQVAGLVLEHGGDEEEAIAALLHDVLEDTDVEKSELVERFGTRVADVVEACSDTTETEKPPWRERKERYVARLATADPTTALVAAADKLHNARSVLTDYRTQGERLWERFRGGRDGTLWYYQAVVDALRGRAPAALLDELARTVGALRAEAVCAGSAEPD